MKNIKIEEINKSYKDFVNKNYRECLEELSNFQREYNFEKANIFLNGQNTFNEKIEDIDLKINVKEENQNYYITAVNVKINNKELNEIIKYKGGKDE